MKILSPEATRNQKLLMAIFIPFFSIVLVKTLELLVVFLFGKEYSFNGFAALALSGVFSIILELAYFNFITEE